MRGAPLAERVREQARADAAELSSVGLATVLVGDDPASHVYVTGKHKAAVEAGFRSMDRRLPVDAAQADLLTVLDELNRDDEVDGILVQLPLPHHIDAEAVLGSSATSLPMSRSARASSRPCREGSAR